MQRGPGTSVWPKGPEETLEIPGYMWHMVGFHPHPFLYIPGDAGTGHVPKCCEGCNASLGQVWHQTKPETEAKHTCPRIQIPWLGAPDSSTSGHRPEPRFLVKWLSGYIKLSSKKTKRPLTITAVVTYLRLPTWHLSKIVIYVSKRRRETIIINIYRWEPWLSPRFLLSPLLTGDRAGTDRACSAPELGLHRRPTVTVRLINALLPPAPTAADMGFSPVGLQAGWSHDPRAPWTAPNTCAPGARGPGSPPSALPALTARPGLYTAAGGDGVPDTSCSHPQAQAHPSQLVPRPRCAPCIFRAHPKVPQRFSGVLRRQTRRLRLHMRRRSVASRSRSPDGEPHLFKTTFPIGLRVYISSHFWPFRESGRTVFLNLSCPGSSEPEEVKG